MQVKYAYVMVWGLKKEGAKISTIINRKIIWLLVMTLEIVIVLIMLFRYPAVQKDILALVFILIGHIIMRQYILNLPISLRGSTAEVGDTAGRNLALVLGVLSWVSGIYGLYIYGGH